MRYPDAQLSLQSLPAPLVVKGISYENIRAARLADFAARFLAGTGDVYDAAALESDPGVILQEEDAYREMLDLAAINDAARAVMLPFAKKSDLDNLAALVGARRLVLTPAVGSTPAVMESDDDFVLRAQLALEGSAVGLTSGGLALIALRASPEVSSISFFREPGGILNVILMGRVNVNGSVSPAAVAAVSAAYNDDWSDDPATGSQLTDVIRVRSTTPLPYDIKIRAIVPSGPTISVVQTASLAAVTVAAAGLQRIGTTVPTDALIAAARVAPITKLYLDSPAADIVCRYDQSPWARSISVVVKPADA